MFRMKREDRRRWLAAQTLGELGELTAGWLEGSIASRPGYEANCAPDPETTETPDLIETLAALNRAGVVTESSQPGFDGSGFDGAPWQQRAAVFGFCDDRTLRIMRHALSLIPYTVIAHPVKDRLFARAAAGVVVSTRNGQAWTRFGRQLGRQGIADCFDPCSTAAFRTLCDVWQVTIYDPDWGRNTIWPELRGVASYLASHPDHRESSLGGWE
jgi:hypothetical protein